jgi:hypothetical protein
MTTAMTRPTALASIRGEYEIFDISDAEDVTLLSAGIVVRF